MHQCNDSDRSKEVKHFAAKLVGGFERVMAVEVSFKTFLRFLNRMVADASIDNGLTAVK